MRVSYLLALFPVAFAVAQTASTIESDLNTVSADTQKFYTDLQSCLGGGGAISINCEVKLQNDEQAIESAVNQTTKDCNGLSGASSTADSKTIYDQLVKLESLNENVLNYIVAHKSQFAASGLTGLVCEDLEDLASETATLAKCLVSHSAKKYVKKGNALAAKYANDFSSAESQFGCSS